MVWDFGVDWDFLDFRGDGGVVEEDVSLPFFSSRFWTEGSVEIGELT